jgi:DNA polymerase-3 subunit chi
MTEVAFHFNVPDKVAYACRLLRKVLRRNAQVVVSGTPELMDLLDKALWTLAPHEFLPHCRASAAPALLAASPIVLAAPDEPVPHQDVLVNLGDEVPPGFGRFARLIEVVSRDDMDDRARARLRWKHYADRGYALVKHDLVLEG